MKHKEQTPLSHPADRVVHKRQLSDNRNDYSYWSAQPPESRLAALEHLRQQYSILVEMELTHDFKEFVRLLNACKAEYMIAGGFAVAIYGYPRYTGDIDIWINPTQENALKVSEVVKEFGYTEGEVTLEDLTTPEIVVQLGYPPNRIDLATGLTGVKFSNCWENKTVLPYGDTMANFISLEDLKKNKKTTARQQDLLDLQNLQD